MKSIVQIIAEEIQVSTSQVEAAVALLDDGATVPFIARYRKEVTGSLDDTQLRHLEERLQYLRGLDERRDFILHKIEDQGKLTPELERSIREAETKARLEDLYLPYKTKKHSKVTQALEAGLEPLANLLWQQPETDPEAASVAYVDDTKGIAEIKDALEGARQILMERFAEDPELNGQLRANLLQQAILKSSVISGQEKSGIKFADYFDFSQLLHAIPAHRALALLRGRRDKVLTLTIQPGATEEAEQEYISLINNKFGMSDQGRKADHWLLETARLAWKIKLFTRFEHELFTQLKGRAEEEAVRVFAGNVKDLLLAAPAGRLPIIGLDPGLRTGVKVAVVDTTSKVVATATIYPHPPQKQWDKARETLAALAKQHAIKLISIGNGTGSRETDRLVRELIKQYPELGLQSIVVNEAGASVYSASELAAHEFPDMDVSLRGAVSIARRLQDPLAELVKIEPKAIGVGQYQHDVNQKRLESSLNNVVEDCVNSVGVDINTASAPLLTRVSGLNSSLAENIVAYRNEHGAFKSRTAIKLVPRLGDKTFQLAAGFLRITDGDNPLDASGVHPESYPVVERIVAASARPIHKLIGDAKFIRNLEPAQFTDEHFGIPTVRDILMELEKPGRDPRPEFKTATFADTVLDIKDLTPGMILEGMVSNVTNFGVFVDIGVHQDGLVHISAMSEQFVKDPRQLVKAGSLVKVRVLEVDLQRRRIALSMRLNETTSKATQSAATETGKTEVAGHDSPKSKSKRSGRGKKARVKATTEQRPTANPPLGGAMAEALTLAIKKARSTP